MKKFALGLVGFLLVVLGFYIPAAYAGNRVRPQVTVVFNSNGTARGAGALATAQVSNDTTQFIGCDVTARQNGTRTTVCRARNAVGTTVTCDTDVAVIAETVGTLNSNSHLTFNVGAAGECTSIIVKQSSQYGF